MPDPPLPSALVERVLEGLGLSEPPPPDFDGLHELYAAWCSRVPFDNLLKRIHIFEQSPAPLPGE